MVMYECIDFLLFIGMMMMMMKCRQKSSLNFFIFAPLNMLNVSFYQLVPRLSEIISTTKKEEFFFH